MGTSFMKTRESMPAIHNFDKDKSKWNTWVGGSASESAQYDVPKKKNETPAETYRRTNSSRKEGAANEHAEFNPNYSTVRELGTYFTDGISSWTSGVGGDNMKEAQEYAILREQSESGAREGKPLNL